MITLLTTPEIRPEKTGRILAIESDPARARTLDHILRDKVRADLEIVKSLDEAVRAIDRRVPDLVLTSTFLPPADAETLTAHLRRLPAAAHVQVITLPHFIDADGSTRDGSGMVLGFLRRRIPLLQPKCDPSTVREQIDEYLEHSRATRERLVAEAAAQEPALVRCSTTEEITALARREHLQQAAQGQASDRRRARRRMSADIPGLWTIKLPWSSEVKVLDISSGGVLVETTSKIAPGSTVSLQVLGHETNLSVPARTVRTEVASVDRLGVRYRVAAAFARELEVFGLHPAPDPSKMPRMLADLLGRVLTDADRSSSSKVLCGKFEQELRRLLPVRDIQIRRTPAITNRDTESIYFAVPYKGGNRQILQATFEPGYQPSVTEFRMLKAAASLAAVVLEFAPPDDVPQFAMLPFATRAELVSA